MSAIGQRLRPLSLLLIISVVTSSSVATASLKEPPPRDAASGGHPDSAALLGAGSSPAGDDFCQLMLHLGRPAVCVTKLDEGAAHGFPRSALPQIIANATDFVSFLTNGGDQVRAAAARVAPLSLMPIERHISLAKARKIARSILRFGWHPRKDEAIVVADDRHILDGHHRWAAMVLLQRPFMDVVRVETGINTLLRLAAAYVRHDRANVPGRPTFVGQPASSVRVRSPLLLSAGGGGGRTSAAAPSSMERGLGHKASLAQLVHDLEEALRRTENYNSTDVDPEWARHRQTARAASVAIEAARADVVSCETAAAIAGAEAGAGAGAAIAGAGTAGAGAGAGAGADGDTCAGPAARITPLSATFHRSLEGMWGVVRRQDAMERELSTREAAVREAMRANQVQVAGQVSPVQSLTAGGGSSSGTPATTSAAISPSSSSTSSPSSSSSASPSPPSSPASSSSKPRPPLNAPGLSAAAATATAAAREAALSLPLHTHGRWIVGADGRRVKLACGSWAGGEQKDMVPAGLDRQRLPVIARAIKAMGLNCVRLLWANDMLSLKVRERDRERRGGEKGPL